MNLILFNMYLIILVLVLNQVSLQKVIFVKDNPFQIYSTTTNCT